MVRKLLTAATMIFMALSAHAETWNCANTILGDSGEFGEPSITVVEVSGDGIQETYPNVPDEYKLYLPDVEYVVIHNNEVELEFVGHAGTMRQHTNLQKYDGKFISYIYHFKHDPPLARLLQEGLSVLTISIGNCSKLD